MAPLDGIAECVNPGGTVEIGTHLLLLIGYRLADPEVWLTDDWLKVVKSLEVAERKREIKLVKSS